MVAVMGGVTGIEQANVLGTVEQVGGEAMAHFALSGLVIAAGLFFIGALIFYPLLVVVGYAVLEEERFRILAHTAAQRGGLSFLVGIGTGVALMIASAIVAATFPVPLPVALILVVTVIVGYCGVSYWVGRSMLRNASVLPSSYTRALLITFIQFIPVIGWLVAFVLWNIAVGASVVSGFGTSVDWLMTRTEPEPWARPAAG